MNAPTDTICAIATPPGLGGISVLRLSGPRALEIAQILATPPLTGGSLSDLLPNTARFARLYNKESFIDDAVLTYFRAPRSYTGDDVVEISCHGGRYAAARILELLLEHGARMARPGEFTERAFLNGKLDLAQAEAVAGLIHARTHRAGAAAARQLAGGLSEKVSAMRSKLLDLLALLELELDFSEEDVQFQQNIEREATLSEVGRELSALAATFERGRLVREGIRVAIVGAPNAGKSTLLNALSGEERAIVSPEPGTTRDVVEAHIELEGVELILQDTAGIRTPSGAIESEGIARTRRAIQNADIVLLVVDRHAPLWPEQEILDSLNAKPTVLVWNKCDLAEPPEHLKSVLGSGRPTAAAAVPAPGRVRASDGELVGIKGESLSFQISALTGSGIEPLLEQIVRSTLGENIVKDDIVIAEARHHDSLTRAAQSIARARTQLHTPTLLASDLRDAVDTLGEITGQSVGEEILDRIFAKFCIGK